jgi:carbonic anhydrase/acetyltransferase-like protein (isoleucine patch superfamily)
MVDTAAAAFIHPSALLYGTVTAGNGVSFWPYSVARAEVFFIEIGDFTNIQDHVMLHVGYNTPLKVGAYCSITHRAVLHGCIIGDYCLIGIGATVMDGAVIGENSIVGEHALVRPGFVAPANSIIAGVPARIVRTQDSRGANRTNAIMYYENALAYAKGHHRVWADPGFPGRIAERLSPEE